MNYIFHPAAEAEFLNAIEYYEDCELNLGYDFFIEVYTTIENILGFPKAWPVLEDDIRRCQIRRFPFGIIYAQHGDEIIILAVMHLRRDPDCWKDRLK